MSRLLYAILLFAILTPRTTAKVWEVHCFHGLSIPRFDPFSLHINEGDTVNFVLDAGCNVIEISAASYNAGIALWNGGFQTPMGGGMVVPAAAPSSPYTSLYYVCPQHFPGTAEVGEICIYESSIDVTLLQPLEACAGGPLTIGFRAAGVYATGNDFQIQLSDELGSFAVPLVLATVPGTTYYLPGQLPSPVGGTLMDTVTAILRATLAPGTGYRVRVVSVMHGIIGTPSSQGIEIHAANPTRFEWTGGVDTDWGTVGNWSEPCAVPGTGDTVIIGPGPTAPADVPPLQLAVLSLDNAAGIALRGTVRITERLSLATGSIYLGNSDLVLLSTAALDGGGPQGFVVTDSAGRLRREGIGLASGTAFFPVGANGASCTPVTIENAGATDDFGVRVSHGVLTDGMAGTALAERVVGRSWHIDEAQPGGSSATLTFAWNAGEELADFDRADCFVAHHDAGGWQALQASASAVGSGPYERSVTNVAVFSPFAIGSSGAYIPVTYRSLTAAAEDGVILLRWQTELEVNSRGFSIERREAACVPSGSAALLLPWQTLGFVESADGGTGYLFIDQPPHAGGWEYRLRQIDLDGSEAWSPSVFVILSEYSLPFSASPVIEAVWPNPLRRSRMSGLAVRYRGTASGDIVLTLHDLLGRRLAELYQGAAFSEPGGVVTVPFTLGGQTAALPCGTYLLRLTTAAGVSQRLLVLD